MTTDLQTRLANASAETSALQERFVTAFGGDDSAILSGWLDNRATELIAAVADSGVEDAAPAGAFGKWASKLSALPPPYGELIAKHGVAMDVSEVLAAAVSDEAQREPHLRFAVYELYGGLLATLQEDLADRGYCLGPLALWLDEDRHSEIELSLSAARIEQLKTRMTELSAQATAALAGGDAEAALTATVDGLRELALELSAHEFENADGERYLVALSRLRLALVETVAQGHWEKGEFKEAVNRYETLFTHSPVPPPTLAFASATPSDGVLRQAILRIIYVEETGSDEVAEIAYLAERQVVWFWGRFLHRRYAEKPEEPWFEGEGLGPADEGAFRFLQRYCSACQPAIEQTADPLSDDTCEELVAAALARDPAELSPPGFHISGADVGASDEELPGLYAETAAPHALERGLPLLQLARGEEIVIEDDGESDESVGVGVTISVTESGGGRSKPIIVAAIAVVALVILGVGGFFIVGALSGPSGPPPLSEEEQAQTTGDGWTPVHAAAGKGERAAFERLLVLQLPLDATDDVGESLLHKAVRRGDAAAIKELALLGANVNLVAKDGNTPLHRAVADDALPMLAALLAAKADTEATDAKGNTPLILAVQKGSQSTVVALFGAGTKPDTPDSQKQTALILVATAGKFEIAEVLLEAAADVNLADADGNTALHRAAAAGHEDISILLVGSGAEVNAQNAEGCTAMDVAKAQKHKPIMKLLKKMGAKRKCKGKKGKRKGKDAKEKDAKE